MTEFSIVFVVFACGMAAGAALALRYHFRFREMRNNMREYAQNYRIIEDNQRLIAQNKTLKTELKLKNSEIQRYRRILVDYAQARKRIHELEREGRELRQQIEKHIEAADQRFGRLMRLIHKNGIKMSQEDLNLLTP